MRTAAAATAASTAAPRPVRAPGRPRTSPRRACARDRSSCSQRVDDRGELGAYRSQRARRIDDTKARRLGTRAGRVNVADARDEILLFALEAVELAAARV